MQFMHHCSTDDQKFADADCEAWTTSYYNKDDFFTDDCTALEVDKTAMLTISTLHGHTQLNSYLDILLF